MFKTKCTLITKSGFTLIETMVVVVIVTVISMGIFGLMLNVLSSYYTLTSLNDLNNSASFAADELINDLRQVDIVMITQSQQVLDPATGERHDILIFPMLNGINNGNPVWQGAIVYYPFTNADGVSQLCRYAHPDASLLDTDFPLTVSVGASAINLFKQDGSALASLNRAGGAQRVLANSISTEDANNNGVLDSNEDDADASLPMDNANGTLDSGIDYTITGNTVFFTIFLQKPVAGVAGTSRRNVSYTLNSAATLRN